MGGSVQHVESAIRGVSQTAITKIRQNARNESRASWEKWAGFAALALPVPRLDETRVTRASSALADTWGKRLHVAQADGLAVPQAARRASLELVPSIDRTAATEAVQAFNAEARAQNDHAAARGYAVTETWQAMMDACPICLDMDGLSVTRPDTFTEEPPLHPHCKCFLTTDYEEAADIAA